MNSKIIGFILSKSKIHFTPKINDSIKVADIKHRLGTLSLYYYGNLEDCKIAKNTYSMGFPASDNLLDHNLILTVSDDVIITENDWLGSIPLFYNSTEKIISTFPKACLLNDKEYDETGLFNYLKYGFSVFEHTPFKAVKFLSFYSKIRYSVNEFKIECKEDPVKQIDEYKGISEHDVWKKIEDYCAKKEALVKGDIVIPTSAGFDSRIVNYFIEDRSRVKNYTYGISANQQKSFEVQQAKKYSRKLGHHWEQIYLHKAFDYITDWHEIFAFSTHLHGMYHIEFYNKVKSLLPNQSVSMVSGICGGVFCGSNSYQLATKPSDLYNLAFTHGLNFNFNVGRNDFGLEKEFMDRYDYLFKDIRLYPLITMRIKLLLLSYSINVPSIMGLPGWTPFLNFDIVMSMLNLPAERRKGRTWVKEFFASKNLLPSNNMLFQDTKNRLNFHLHSNYTFDAINADFQLPYMNKEVKDDINAYLGNIDFMAKINYQLTTTRVIKEVLKKFGITNEFFDYLTNYQTLKAIEMSV